MKGKKKLIIIDGKIYSVNDWSPENVSIFKLANDKRTLNHIDGVVRFGFDTLARGMKTGDVIIIATPEE